MNNSNNDHNNHNKIIYNYDVNNKSYPFNKTFNLFVYKAPEIIKILLKFFHRAIFNIQKSYSKLTLCAFHLFFYKYYEHNIVYKYCVSCIPSKSSNNSSIGHNPLCNIQRNFLWLHQSGNN